MTQEDKNYIVMYETIKAEIERLISNISPASNPALFELLDFIESLEKEKSEIPTIRGYVARLENGDLGLSASKPYYCTIDGKKIIGIDGGGFLIDSSLFPDLKWEDEPIEVELIIHRV